MINVTIDGKTVPVAQVVEPTPIRYIGNYLAFAMNSDVANDIRPIFSNFN